MNPFDDSVYNYDRELLAKAIGVEEEVVDGYFLINKIDSDTTYQTVLKASKIVFVVCSTLGVVLNMVCIFLMASMKRPLKTSIKLLLTLSISDACRSSLDVVFYFYPYNNARIFKADAVTSDGESTFTVILHRAFTSMNILTDVSGQITIIMLAVVIFIAVKKPMSYNSLMSNHGSTGIILFIWVTGGCVVICFNIILQEMINDKKLSLEQLNVPMLEMQAFIGLLSAYRYTIIAIFCIIVLLNIAIYIQVRISTLKSSNSRRRRRFIFILILITTCFFVTNLPIIVQSLTVDVDFEVSELYSNKFIVYLWSCTPYLFTGWRSFGNAIVYTVRLPEIREQFSTVFCPEREKKLNTRLAVVSFVYGDRSKMERHRRIRRTASKGRVNIT